MATALTNILGGSVIDGVSKIISLFKVDPTVALQNRTEIEKIQLQMVADAQSAAEAQIAAQLQINLAEAQSKSAWVAGWRPFLGWILGTALGYSLVLQPMAQFILVACHRQLEASLLPSLNTPVVMSLLGSLLGLGAMRSYDKSLPGDGGVGKASG